MSSGYPKRDQFFAHKFVRVLFKSCAALDLGQSACLLLTFIAHQEDSSRYRGPVKFWNQQLMSVMGFRSPKSLNEARDKCVKAGWLVYDRSGNREVGLYHVTIPDEFLCLTDSPIEDVETDILSRNHSDIHSENGTDRERKAEQIGNGWVTESGKPSIPIPNPIPFPEERDADAEESAPSPPNPPEVVSDEKTKSPPYNLIAELYVASFGGKTHLTEKRKAQMRARWRDEWWRKHWQEALDRASASSFLHGDNDRGWRMDLGFFLQQDSVAKILEGKYDDNGSSNRRKRTAAEEREQLNAASFQRIRDAAAQNAAGRNERIALPAGTGTALLVEEHRPADSTRG